MASVSVSLALVSSLQMFHQGLLSSLSNELGDVEMLFASASFPVGKLCSTALLAVFPPSDVSLSLRVAARLLIVGSVIAVLPMSAFLLLGRFLIGSGAGIGFVSSSVYLTILLPYSARPSYFFVLGIAFSSSSLIANILHFVSPGYLLLISLSSFFTFLCGVLYLLYEPPLVVSGPSSPMSSYQPMMLCIILMAMNVTIGVPMLIGYAPVLLSEMGSSGFWSFYPLFQFFLQVFLHRHPLPRKILVLGGFSMCLFIWMLLLLTIQYPFLPPQTRSLWECVWTICLCVFVCVPANTSLCVITEQHEGSEDQMRLMAVGRSVQWMLSAISTSSFVPSLAHFGLLPSLVPYALFSFFFLIILFIIFPKDA